MKLQKPNEPSRWVWRISPEAPHGAWVDRNAPPPRPSTTQAAQADLAEVSTGGWVVSSFDLLRGADVSSSGDTVSDELFDELFPPAPNADAPDRGSSG